MALEDTIDIIATEDGARQHRDRLLRDTDWWMLSDTGTPTSEQLTYRQNLRDVPSQAGFPTSITWPTKPS